MKRLAAVTAVFLLTLAPALGRTQQPQKPIPLNPPPSSSPASVQTIGAVGKTNYAWANGNAWQTMDDTARAAMVVGIEQGVVLGVRENWGAVPEADQAILTRTAERLTVSGASFDDVVTKIDQAYMDTNNVQIPIVDAYMYVVLELKNTPKHDLEGYLKLLQKTYPPPKPGNPQEKH